VVNVNCGVCAGSCCCLKRLHLHHAIAGARRDRRNGYALTRFGKGLAVHCCAAEPLLQLCYIRRFYIPDFRLVRILLRFILRAILGGRNLDLA
jgi:hypothetical protein